MCNVGHRSDIDDLQQRVGRRLQVNQLGVVGDGCGYRAQIAEIHIANLDAALGQNAREQPIAAAVQIVAGQDFVSRHKQPRNGCNGCQSGAEAEAARATLQRRDLFLHYRTRGITAARIIVFAELGCVRLAKRSRLVDGRVGGSVAIAWGRVERQ